MILSETTQEDGQLRVAERTPAARAGLLILTLLFLLSTLTPLQAEASEPPGAPNADPPTPSLQSPEYVHNPEDSTEILTPTFLAELYAQLGLEIDSDRIHIENPELWPDFSQKLFGSSLFAIATALSDESTRAAALYPSVGELNIHIQDFFTVDELYGFGSYTQALFQTTERTDVEEMQVFLTTDSSQISASGNEAFHTVTNLEPLVATAWGMGPVLADAGSDLSELGGLLYLMGNSLTETLPQQLHPTSTERQLALSEWIQFAAFLKGGKVGIVANHPDTPVFVANIDLLNAEFPEQAPQILHLQETISGLLAYETSAAFGHSPDRFLPAYYKLIADLRAGKTHDINPEMQAILERLVQQQRIPNLRDIESYQLRDFNQTAILLPLRLMWDENNWGTIIELLTLQYNQSEARYTGAQPEDITLTTARAHLKDGSVTEFSPQLERDYVVLTIADEIIFPDIFIMDRMFENNGVDLDTVAELELTLTTVQESGPTNTRTFTFPWVNRQ